MLPGMCVGACVCSCVCVCVVIFATHLNAILCCTDKNPPCTAFAHTHRNAYLLITAGRNHLPGGRQQNAHIHSATNSQNRWATNATHLLANIVRSSARARLRISKLRTGRAERGGEVPACSLTHLNLSKRQFIAFKCVFVGVRLQMGVFSVPACGGDGLMLALAGERCACA